MKRLLVFLLAFSLLNVSMAQEISPPDTSKTFKHRGFEFHSILKRVEFLPEIKLNPLLQKNGYPEMGNFAFNILVLNSWGFGAQYRMGMLNIGVDIMGSSYIRENEIERTEIEYSVFSANFLLSYYLNKNGEKTMYLYPFIGFSGYGYNLYLTRPSASKPINDLLASPNNALHLRHSTDGFTFGFGADFGSLYNEESELLSIRIGYRYSLDGAIPWKAPATTIPDAPRDHFNQFFIQLNVGGMLNWGGKKKKK